ncbi:hypothetical protein HOY82DRAFT_610303 [Tuber indicum]|nr:hypothetical protein HOY82DRAFT_610303 [Tuber indicum]
MRGPGEPIFEHDFPPGTDIAGETLAGPSGQERFELEMASRPRGDRLGQSQTTPAAPASTTATLTAAHRTYYFIPDSVEPLRKNCPNCRHARRADERKYRNRRWAQSHRRLVSVWVIEPMFASLGFSRY